MKMGFIVAVVTVDPEAPVTAPGTDYCDGAIAGNALGTTGTSSTVASIRSLIFLKRFV